MIKDTYLTVSTVSEGLYREKGSKFLAYIHPITSVEEVKDLLIQSRKNHPKSRHHCYAYSIGIDGEPSNFNDDGEPSGSAGRPIMGQIRSAELSDCCVIVVRYFGGTKLGVSGLINAYKLATKYAIEANVIITKQLSDRFQLNASYADMGLVLESIKRSNIKLIKKQFEENIRLVFEIPKSETASKMHLLKAYLLGINPKELLEELELDGIDIIEL